MSHETFTAPELDQLAELLPAYEFDSFIAKGGMGAVYKAKQISLDREVAIKILPRELGADPEFRESFETEAKAMAKLNHPNLLGVYDFGDIDGMPYIVMELVFGKSLYHSAWNKVIEPQQAIAIVKGICDGIQHAHEHGILHRDIKPANILLTPKAEPKIGDFGLAQHTDSAGTGEVMGTPGYAAPELIHHPEAAGIGTDIYAIGVILHELLTGQRPDPTGVETPQPFGDRRLDAIWQKATNPVISNRYASAEEMAQALVAWQPTTRRLATGTGTSMAAPRSLVTAAPSTTSIPRPSITTKPPTSSSSTGRNAAIILILLAVLAIGFKMFGQGKDNTATDNQTVADPTNNDPEIATTSDDPGTTTSPVASDPSPERPIETPIPPIEIDETTTESLARLKGNLTQGRRDEMPKGSKRHGMSDYLIVETPMTWYAAQLFAEAHDGHLAILETEEELSWLSQIIPDSDSVWIGSGRSEKNVWSDNDGTNWDLDETPKGVGPFASLNNFGILRAGKAGETKPFVIQWHRDGTNPGTLKAILERTKSTLDTPNPIYPPGTISMGTHRCLLLPVPVKRAQAEELAVQAGGILAIPSTRDEIGWLSDETESMQTTAGYWLGGQRKNGTWAWDADEAWEMTDWIDETEPSDGGDALIFIPGKGWSNAEASSSAAGLLIEWSPGA